MFYSKDTIHSNRRLFLKQLSAVSGAYLCLPIMGHAQAESNVAQLAIDRGGKSLRRVPENFVGLSYENMQLEDASFFSPANKSLVAQFRSIAPRGVLRLGGNTSEFGWWKGSAAEAAPQRAESPWKATGEPTSATTFAITPEAIDNLDGFLRATGWTCIYGLNLGYGTPERDLPEAKYVFNKLGSRLLYFQVGNEVDLFRQHLRDPATWNVDKYLGEWLAIARPVQKALPTAKFGLPDVASDVRWLPQIASRWGGISEKPNVVSLSHHYYWSGPPSKPEVNIANLMKADPKVASQAALTRSAAEQFGGGVEWRMTEGNTVYRGGKYGVSDVFASALWSADYLLQLMSQGYSGVNLHGGSGHAQAVSVGGTFHGEALMPDPTVPHPKPFYTPIANEGTLAGAGVNGKLSETYVLEPVAYGMKFAGAFTGATMLPIKWDSGNVNATAYAAKKQDGEVLLAIINKDATQSVSLHDTSFHVTAILSAPALDSRQASLQQGDPGKLTSATGTVVPPHTAVLAISKA